MNILMRCRFGSHLYGTDNEFSDFDFKSVFMPSLRELLLNSYKPIISVSSKGQNNPGDVDEEFISLPRFLRLACENRPHAIEMLHAEGENLLQTSPIWTDIQSRRKSFYSKNIDNLVAFATAQAERYVNKAESYSILSEIKAICDRHPIKTRIKYIADLLPVNAMCRHEPGERNIFYVVGDKRFEYSIMIKDMLPSIRKMINMYGERVQQMNSEDKVIDWQSVTQAMRSAYQTIRLLREGDFYYPLPEADYLRDIKLGKIDYTQVQQELILLSEEVQKLKAQSNLPDEVNFESWEDRLIGYYLNYYTELQNGA